MVISLKERESNLDQPVVGYNDYDGFYVKLVYRYFMKSGFYGLLLLDWFERSGLGQGVKQYFPSGDKDLFFNFYNFNNYRTGGRDIQAGAGWSHKLGPLYDYSLDAEYWQKSTLQWQGSDYGTFEYDEYRFRAVLNGKDRVWPFNINLEGGKRYSYSEYYFYPRVQLTWRPSSRHSVTYSGRLDHRERPDTLSVTTRYIYNLQTTHNFGGYQLRTEVYEAADHSPEPLANWYSLNRLPSVRLTTPVYRWGSWVITVFTWTIYTWLKSPTGWRATVPICTCSGAFTPFGSGVNSPSNWAVLYAGRITGSRRGVLQDGLVH